MDLLNNTKITSVQTLHSCSVMLMLEKKLLQTTVEEGTDSIYYFLPYLYSESRKFFYYFRLREVQTLIFQTKCIT